MLDVVFKSLRALPSYHNLHADITTGEITQIHAVCFLLSAAELKRVNAYGEVSE